MVGEVVLSVETLVQNLMVAGQVVTELLGYNNC
jgi:hypothetical protein